MTESERHHEPAGPEEGRHPIGGLRSALLVSALAALGVVWGWPVLVMVVGLVAVLFLHELGHFVAARRSGMLVTEFFVGRGPTLWSFRRGETVYGIKALPVGAYVRIVGMHNLDETDPSDEPRTYRRQSFPRRVLVMSAGALMHLAQAFVLLVLLLGVVGVPGGSLAGPSGPPDAWEVDEVIDGTGAAAAGLRADDRVVAVDGVPAARHGDLGSALGAHDVGDEVRLTVVRDGVEREVVAVVGDDPAGQGRPSGAPFLGLATRDVYSDRPIGVATAAARAPGEMVRFAGLSLDAFAGAFSPGGIGDVAGDVRSSSDQGAAGATAGSSGGGDGGEGRLISIVGFVRLGSQDVADRTMVMLALFFQINVVLAIFNMLPLPPLDGGYVAMAIYERLRSRRGRHHADFGRLLPLTYAVVLVFIVMGVASTYLDIVDPLHA